MPQSHALIDDLLLLANKHGASDLIVRTGDRIRMRIGGDIVTIPQSKVSPPTREQSIAMVQHLSRHHVAESVIETINHLDFHYSLQNACHFRIHVLRTNTNFGIVARLIPQTIPDFEQLRLPAIFDDISHYRNGIILFAGAAGSGKSTSQAALLNHIIQQRPVHAVTLEDPIEFRYSTQHKGTVSQREIGTDVCSYKQGLIDALRETPDIIVAGEVRGREEIQLDDSEVNSFLQGKCVLVTGAGGSIGSELCRQILVFQPSQLLMFDHGEFNLYSIDQELSAKHDAVVAILGDMRDEARVRWIFETWHPDVVFNAAAYKHVPLVEGNPAEGVKTNVLGTCQLADIAVEYACNKFVQVSTDKAVNPANVMGASKRAAEIYCQNLNQRQQKTAFITTRFGNVLGSAGSVVPLFQKQIEKGGPITVTHPDMTRYFMTIPEAVSLILQAGSMGAGGEIFVLDMGSPMKITDLAEQMIHLSGLELGKDIEIQFTGLRPGEKLYEELFHEQEALVGTEHPKIMLSASRDMDWNDLHSILERLQAACVAREVVHVKVLLKELVPEFVATQCATDISKGKVSH